MCMCVSQVVQCLPSNLEALSSHPSADKKKKKKGSIKNKMSYHHYGPKDIKRILKRILQTTLQT
jgi:hypothetical protein